MKKKIKTRRSKSPRSTGTLRKRITTSRSVPRRFGLLSDKMKDHVYYLRHGYLYTTPCIACRLNMKFYTAILLTADRKPFSIQIGDTESTHTALMIRHGTKFEFKANDIEFVCVFVEPTHPSFGAFSSIPALGMKIDRELFAKLDQHISDAYRGKLSRDRALQLFETSIKVARENLSPCPTLDHRVVQAINLLEEEPKTSLAGIAKSLELSSFRFSHLFAESLGITLRRFLQWRKVTVTASLLQTRSVTEVAHEAGFTDSAHLSRTFQDLFGIPPSYLKDEMYVRRFFYQ